MGTELITPIFMLFIFNFAPCLCQVTVTQPKKFMKVQVGSVVSLECEQSDTSGTYNMFWYQQKQGKGLELMATSLAAGDATEEAKFKTFWKMLRHNATHSVLQRNVSTDEDSATYFCASSMPRGGNQRQYFGQGTVLSVLGENEIWKNPKVKIFPPNKREFQEYNLISLVCFASDFFPKHVRLTWYVNNKEREGLYQNVPQINPDKATYSTSKRLSLTKAEYFNPDAIFRCEAGFIGNDTVSDEIRGETDCGVSKESFAMYVNQGKISYIMVLFKSGLYALIVLAIIWRRKVLSGSC